MPKGPRRQIRELVLADNGDRRGLPAAGTPLVWPYYEIWFDESAETFSIKHVRQAGPPVYVRRGPKSLPLGARRTRPHRWGDVSNRGRPVVEGVGRGGVGATL